MIAGRRGVEASPNGQKLNGSPQASLRKDHTTMEKSNDRIPADELRFAARQARIGHSNELFARADPAKKRITIAKDVLKWLATGKLKPAHHYILLAPKKTEPASYNMKEETVNGYACTACGLGALFACAVERNAAGGTLYNDQHTALRDGIEELWPVLSGIFPEAQLACVECAYEGNPSYYVPGGPKVARDMVTAQPDGDALLTRCFSFRECISDDRKRMEAIMRNIITNRGTFVP